MLCTAGFLMFLPVLLLAFKRAVFRLLAQTALLVRVGLFPTVSTAVYNPTTGFLMFLPVLLLAVKRAVFRLLAPTALHVRVGLFPTVSSAVYDPIINIRYTRVTAEAKDHCPVIILDTPTTRDVILTIATHYEPNKK